MSGSFKTKPLAIPTGVYYGGEGNNFYRNGRGCGTEFYNTWKDRKMEFPKSAYEVRIIITRDDAKKLLECYDYRDLLASQKAAVIKDTRAAYDVTIYLDSSKQQETFNVPKQVLVNSITAKEVALDLEIRNLCGSTSVDELDIHR